MPDGGPIKVGLCRFSKPRNKSLAGSYQNGMLPERTFLNAMISVNRYKIIKNAVVRENGIEILESLITF
jgi:hypothetical protein